MGVSMPWCHISRRSQDVRVGIKNLTLDADGAITSDLDSATIKWLAAHPNYTFRADSTEELNAKEADRANRREQAIEAAHAAAADALEEAKAARAETDAMKGVLATVRGKLADAEDELDAAKEDAAVARGEASSANRAAQEAADALAATYESASLKVDHDVEDTPRISPGDVKGATFKKIEPKSLGKMTVAELLDFAETEVPPIVITKTRKADILEEIRSAL